MMASDYTILVVDTPCTTEMANSLNSVLLIDAPKALDCTCECGKTLAKSYYNRHKKKCNGVAQNAPERKICSYVCQEPDCSFEIIFHAQFLAHLMNHHSIEPIIEVKRFESNTDFEEWKEEVERETKANYCLSSVKKTKCGPRLKYFECNRSGRHRSKSTGKRGPKSIGSCKIGMKCPAMMKAKFDEHCKDIHVTFYSMHYGHDNQLAYLRLSKSDRHLLAGQLSLGMNKARVLDNVFPRDPNELKRQHLTTRQDLKNIARAFGVSKVEKQPKGYINVHSYFEQDLENEKNIFLYKRQGEQELYYPKDEETAFENEDFAIGIMTEFQCSMLKEFGSGTVCLDATQGTTACDYNLVTVLVVDEFREGIPVAWLVCNRETSHVLKLFFSLLKRKVGSIKPSIIMSVKAPQYYEAWTHVFQSKPKKLLCLWHVHYEWNRNLNEMCDEETAAIIYKGLCVLLEEPDKEQFEELLETALIELQEDERTLEFSVYFESEWINMKEQWAKCYRTVAEVDTNVYVESFYKSLKFGENCTKGKQGKRIDKCFTFLLQYSKNLAISRLTKLEKSKNTWKTTAINNRHTASLELPLTLVKSISDTSWEVTCETSLQDTLTYLVTETGLEKNIAAIAWEVMPETPLHGAATLTDNITYLVTKEPDCTLNCLIKCAHCNICVHSFTCNCPDAVSKGNTCKHIHLVVRFVSKNNAAAAAESLPSAPAASVPESIIEEDCSPENIENDYISENNIETDCTPENDGAASNLNTSCSRKDEMKKDSSDVTELKRNLLSKAMALCGYLKKCDNKESLLIAKEYINSAVSVLKIKNVHKRRE